MSEPITRVEWERELAHLRELLGERDKALELQAREYERRLDLLNHAHQEARENWERSLPRERYEADQRARAAQLMAWVFALLAAVSTVFAILRYWLEEHGTR